MLTAVPPPSLAPDSRRVSPPALLRWRAALAGRGWPFLALVLAAAITAAPLLHLMAIALGFGPRGLAGTPDLWNHLFRYVLPAALWDTALLLGGVGMLAGTIGVVTAWLVTVYRFPGRDTLAWLLVLPLAVPTYIVAYVYADLLEPLGPVQTALRALTGVASPRDLFFPDVRSLGGAIVLIAFVVYPYVYLGARSMFATQSASLIEAARTLGASPARTLTAVALPLARPALAVGLAMALLETLNDIGAAEYLGVQTLTRAVATTWLNRSSLEGAAQIALAMLALVAALLWLEAKGREGRRFTGSTRRPRLVAPLALTGARGLGALIACAVPVLIGFAVPAGFLLAETWRRGLWRQADASFLAALGTTVTVSAGAALLIVALGFVAVLALRRRADRPARALRQIAGLGYAVPGTVLALALLGPLVALDGILNSLWRMMGGSGFGLVLSGSAAALVIAYSVRFVPIALGTIGAGLDRLPPSVDEAARMLGAGRGEIARRLHAPLALPALGAAGLLVFIDCVKELPATLLLRPLNVETLATHLYGLASQGQFERGALAALAIVMVGLYPALRMARLESGAALSSSRRADP